MKTIRGCLLGCLGPLLLATACSGTDAPSPPMLSAADPEMMAAPSPAEACANHEESCPCNLPGDVIDCGRVKRVAGDYVWCATGMQTCDDDGRWGPCVGDAVAAAPNP